MGKCLAEHNVYLSTNPDPLADNNIDPTIPPPDRLFSLMVFDLTWLGADQPAKTCPSISCDPPLSSSI
jgi:hypothetical protein